MKRHGKEAGPLINKGRGFAKIQSMIIKAINDVLFHK